MLRFILNIFCVHVFSMFHPKHKLIKHMSTLKVQVSIKIETFKAEIQCEIYVLFEETKSMSVYVSCYINKPTV